MTVRGRVRVVVAAVASALAVSGVAVGTARADHQTITVFPDNPTFDNCYPFGVGAGDSWSPYMAFIYQDIPPFELKAGDILAFDLANVNDVDVELEIALARTTTNGGTQEAQPFQKVVSNTQTPLNPRGDTTVGNFELQFTAEAPFNFPGGGLIIRFSDPSASYAADNNCDPVLVAGTSGDPTGFFVQRGYRDADGVSPWENPGGGDIGAFQLRIADATCKGQQATLVGTPGDDDLTGTNDDDSIVGLGGDDVIGAAGGEDCLSGDRGRDVLRGGAGHDLALGGPGKDKLRGQNGRDKLRGKSGRDKVNGGNGKDKLKGGPGEDKLRGAGAKDKIKGNAGADKVGAHDGRKDRINCGGGNDRAVVDAKDKVKNCETVKVVD